MIDLYEDYQKILFFLENLKTSLPQNENLLYLEEVNLYIFYNYVDRLNLNKISSENVIKYIKDKLYIIGNHVNKNYSLIYNQPIMYLIYYLIVIESEITISLWPYLDKELDILFCELGISTGND